MGVLYSGVTSPPAPVHLHLLVLLLRIHRVRASSHCMLSVSTSAFLASVVRMAPM